MNDLIIVLSYIGVFLLGFLGCALTLYLFIEREDKKRKLSEQAGDLKMQLDKMPRSGTILKY